MSMMSTGIGQSRNRKWIFFVLLGLAAVGLFFLIRGGPPRSDQEQIQAVLTEGERAVEEKDLSAIMQYVSKDYKDDLGLNRDRMRLLIAQTFREHGPIYVALNNVSIQPQGETATVSATVTIEAQGKESNETSSNTYPMTLQFRKEPGYRFLVIPTEYWRVVSAGGSGFQLDSGFMGF